MYLPKLSANSTYIFSITGTLKINKYIRCYRQTITGKLMEIRKNLYTNLYTLLIKNKGMTFTQWHHVFCKVEAKYLL